MKQQRSPEITTAQVVFVLFIAALFALWSAPAGAQVAPGTFTTVKSTSTAATSMCVGCPTGTTTPAANSGITVRTIVIPTSGAPSDTTLKIYQVGGALFFNGLALATGSSISGTTNTVSKFTSATVLGDSTITDNGTTVTIAALTQSNGTVTSGTNGAAGSYIVNGPSATNRVLAFRTAGVARWFAYTTSVAETGANAGSNFRLDAYDDAGSLIGTAMLVTRATMAITLGQNLTVTGTSALGGATTVATSFQLTGAAPVFLGNTNNGYLFRNSTNGATLFSITDAGVGSFTGAFGVTGNFAVNTTAFTVVAASGNTAVNGTFGSVGATRLGSGTTATGWGVNAAGDWTFGATNIADSVGTPAFSSGFATTGRAIRGQDYAFGIVLGSEASTGGVVNFGHTWSTTPICTLTPFSGSLAAAALNVSNLTTTQLTIAYSSVSGAGNGIFVQCRSY